MENQHVSMTEKCFASVLEARHLIAELETLGSRDYQGEWIEPDEIMELANRLVKTAHAIWDEALSQ